jgi:hypothetical protein
MDVLIPGAHRPGSTGRIRNVCTVVEGMQGPGAEVEDGCSGAGMRAEPASPVRYRLVISVRSKEARRNALQKEPR